MTRQFRTRDKTRDIFDQIAAYASGTPINVVNPDVLPAARMSRGG
jgi:hypothetical protein